MKQLLLGSNNAGKLAELKRMLEPLGFDVVGARQAGVELDVVEDEATFIGNAKKKAREFAEASRLLTLADDSGLEVDALGGAPGVLSARFSGPDATDASNNALLLERLHGVEARTARFQCALALASAAGEILHVTTGTIEGRILDTPRGHEGFGYDPLFLPVGSAQTMAELSAEAKGSISHRGRAFAQMRQWLSERRLNF